MNFNNYKWWTAFTYNPNQGYYYNGGLGTTFAPEHVVVDRQGDLHLRMAKDWNNNTEWAGAEAVLMFRADGTEANLGYGDYLVAAEIVKPLNATFATLDPNVALGMFTYERPAYRVPIQQCPRDRFSGNLPVGLEPRNARSLPVLRALWSFRQQDALRRERAVRASGFHATSRNGEALRHRTNQQDHAGHEVARGPGYFREV